MVKSKQNEFLYTALMGVFLLTSYTSIYGLKTRNIIHPSSINGLILSSYVGFITCTAAILTLSIYNVYKATNHKNYNITPKKNAHSNTLQVVQKSNYMESTSSIDSDFLDGDLIHLSESTSGINSPTSPLHEETSIENTNNSMILNLTSPLTPTVLTPFSTHQKPLSSDLKVKDVKVGNKVKEDLDNLTPSDLINGISSTTSNQPQNTSHNQNKSAIHIPSPIPKRPLLDLGLKVKDTEISNTDFYNKIERSDQSPNTAVAVLPPALPFSEHEEPSNISQQSLESKPNDLDLKVEDAKEDRQLDLISPPIPVQLQNIDNAQDVFIAPPPPPMPKEPLNISQQSSESKPCDQSRTALLDAIKRFPKEGLKALPKSEALANNTLISELFAQLQKREKANCNSDSDSDSDKNEWGETPESKLSILHQKEVNCKKGRE